MEFLYFLEGLRNPIFDFLMSAVTNLGAELLFILIALIFFWCVDKYEGYYLMSVGFMGVVINQFLKILVRIPRPWVLDKDFKIVESARAEATGYSFPSGHTQSSVGTYGSIALWHNKKWLRIVCAAVIILVPFSRMYLGVHTPKDVIVSFVIAWTLAIIMLPLIKKGRRNRKYMWALIGVMALLSFANLLFVELYNFPLSTDAANLLSARENAYKLFGCILAMATVYFVDEKYIKFKTDGSVFFQIFKIAVGLIIVLGVQKGMKPLFGLLFGGSIIADAVRYFCVVIAAGIVWPFIFTKLAPRFERKRKNDG